MKITNTNAHEIEVHRWSAEASAIGIKPGQPYPWLIGTDLGNGQPFQLQHVDADRTAHYQQEFGCLNLKVWND